MKVTHGSLFSGIGGIDLGFEWAGIETKWQVEIDEYCQKLLSIRFPHTEKFTDVRKVGVHNLEKVDIISGGFPCQDISVAGKGAGLEGERSGLWTELHRVISELRPRFAFIENVPMLTIRGGTRVISDLAEIGYDAEWQIVGADDVSAWHKRKRIWIVAYPGNGSDPAIKKQEKEKNRISEKHRQKGRTRMFGGTNNDREISSKEVSDTDIKRLERYREECELGESGKEISVSRGSDVSDTKSKFITRINNQNIGNKKQRKFRGSSGKNRKFEFWATEPEVGRVADGIPYWVDRLKGIGNAVVPHIPYIIGKRLKELCQRNQAEKH